MGQPPEPTSIPTGNTYDKYGSTHPIERLLMRRFLEALDCSLPAHRPRTVLEVGVGEAEVARRIKHRWPGTLIVGLDLPDHELAASWDRAELQGVFGDVQRLPFPDRSFDLVLAIEVLEHVSDPVGALQEIARVSASDVVLSVPREPVWRLANLARGKYVRELGNTPGHVQHWSARSFTSFVNSHLDLRAVRRPLPWTIVAASTASGGAERGG